MKEELRKIMEAIKSEPKVVQALGVLKTGRSGLWMFSWSSVRSGLLQIWKKHGPAVILN